MTKNKYIFIVLLILLIFIPYSLATCTVTFDQTEYNPAETMTATMTCSGNIERNQAYTLTWTNTTTTLEIDTGTTPATKNTAFFQTYVIPSYYNGSDITATLTGTSLEGSDTASVSGNATNILIINDAKFSPIAKLGEVFAIDFEVKDYNGKLIDEATCSVYATDENDAPLQECTINKYSKSIHGRAICSGFTNPKALKENKPYIAKIRCHCHTGDNSCFDEDTNIVESKSGSTAYPFTVTPWLDSVNTITDKSSYKIDEEILTCVNVTNLGDERISLDIVYNWRCQNGEDDASTDRIVFQAHKEERGISANTTQNQCAKFRIPDESVIEKGATNCYAATSVTVLDESKEGIITYDTTSPLFNMNVTHIHPYTEWKQITTETYRAEFSIEDYNVGIKNIEVTISPRLGKSNTPATMIKSYSVTYSNGSAVPYDIELEIEREFRNLEEEDVLAIFIEDVNTTLNESFIIEVNLNSDIYTGDIKMIAIILIYILLGGFYFVFGNLNQKNIKMDSTKVATWLTLLSYSMIIIKGITLSYFAVASYMNYSISTLLNAMFIIDLIVLSGISLLTMIFAVLGYMNPDLNNGKWEPRKW